MSWTSQELGAIGRYAKIHNLRLALSTKPVVTYYDKEGKEVKVDIHTVNVEAETNKKEEASERRREKQRIENEKPRYEWQKPKGDIIET